MRQTAGMVRILADAASRPSPGLAAGAVVTGLLCCTAVFAGAVLLVLYVVRRRGR